MYSTWGSLPLYARVFLSGPRATTIIIIANVRSIMSLLDSVMLPVMHRVTNDESAGLARMPTWDDYSGPRKIIAGIYVGPTVEPSTWAVITASAVRRTVTHVNAHSGSKAAILAPEKLLFRLALSDKCSPRDEGGETGEGGEGGDSARTRRVYPGD